MSVTVHVICTECNTTDSEVLAPGTKIPVPFFTCVCGNDQFFEVTSVEQAS